MLTGSIYVTFFAPQDEEEGFKMAPSNFVPTVGEGVETYASKTFS